jgi:hypothetical protein
MTAVLSPTSSPATSPPTLSPPGSNSNHPALTPLNTSPSARRTNLQRPMSHASKNRLSQYSNTSGPSKSRPPSHVFPTFHSSLPYTTVRDFAYTISNPLHYGPPPEPSQATSGLSTPTSESQKRLSDPPPSWESRGGWAPSSWGDGASIGEQLAPLHFGDGPPYSEDEDLQSPVVVTTRHKKHKSSGASYGRGRSRASRDESGTAGLMNPENFDQDRGYFAGQGEDGSERYYVSQGGEANGPGGEYVTYPPDQARHGGSAPHSSAGQRDSHFAGGLLPSRSYTDSEMQGHSDSEASSDDSSQDFSRDESRYSRDYQFTIASPDEEMHGKAVALFDFERENENELPLVEGQVIWVSYRHGQGWLVAEDPKTHESGLVPEEYVRLLRDIQGGLHSLTGQSEPGFSPEGADSGTPTQADHEQLFPSPPAASSARASNGSNGYQQPVVSTFSTSSKDLHPFPTSLLGTSSGMAPPQVVHYHGQRGGSQSGTPTVASSGDHVDDEALKGKGKQFAAGGDEIERRASPMDVDSDEDD